MDEQPKFTYAEVCQMLRNALLANEALKERLLDCENALGIYAAYRRRIEEAAFDTNPSGMGGWGPEDLKAAIISARDKLNADSVELGVAAVL